MANKHKEEEPKPNPNPEIKTYKKVNGKLVITKTHEKPVIYTESYNIKDAQAKIDKIDNVITIWNAKKIPYQAIINKYNKIL